MSKGCNMYDWDNDSEETLTEEEEREEREHSIMDRLLHGKPRYRHLSAEPNILIAGENYSLRWIMLYARARHHGIACMYTSSCYANEVCDGNNEYHEVEIRPVDAQVLWQAHRYWTRPRKTLKKGQP